MKKFILIITLICIGVFANAQTVQTVPKAVQEKFNTLFPNATAVKWAKKGVDYQASFKFGANSMKALFAKNGIFIQKEMSIPLASLPEATKTYIETHCSGKKASSASKVTMYGGTVVYKVIVGGKEMTFDSSGKYTSAKK
ncbi:MAG TPA: hypothetical protein VFJ43_12600 [Bacteroidia bacterium]|nr:hypothetical protein [Bacteroidia bacterium]